MRTSDEVQARGQLRIGVALVLPVAVRVSLLYNRSAGEGVPLDHIHGVIERHGHEVVCVVENDDEAKRLLEGRPDVVAAAGGDGTAALAARVLAHRGIPLAILPIGTANNIAKSLRVRGSIDDLVRGWNHASRVSLDLGIADGVGGRRQFVEAMGGGLIPAAIADMQTRSDGDELPVRAKLAGAVRTIGRVLSRLRPVRITVAADGVRTTGEFLLVEVLNIRSIGPNLIFSSDADPSDGLFHVVTAGEEHRDEIARYLQDTLDGREYALSLPSIRARHVTLQGATDIHLDDQVAAASPGRMVSMSVDAGALDVLVRATDSMEA
jgi:diacylglycerol kinase family enzyme